MLYTRGSQTVGPAPRGAVGLLGWARIVCVRDIYFERSMGARYNIYFGRHSAWLKYFTYRLLLPVLAPNYKQPILLPAKVSFLSVSQQGE
jgi:hypothetical protein